MLILFLLLSLTHPNTQTKSFDRIDINEYYDPNTGKLRLSQLIYYDWSGSEKRFATFGFTLKRDIISGPHWNGNGYEFLIKRNGERWCVTTNIIIKSKTTYDPEELDRKKYPDIIREWE